MRSRTRRSGLTLIELLVALALMTVLATALNYGFIAGLDMERVHARRQADTDQTEILEQHLTRMLQSAVLNSDTTDTTTFFVASATYSGNDTDLGMDSLIFTTAAPDIPMAAQHSSDDFETQQRDRGPIGGVAEVAWETTPVGDPGNKSGIYERVQRPSDGDPTQGGMETVLTDEIDRIGFQFWNGTDWVDAWDTVNDTRRLPAAVKINYTLKKNPNAGTRVLVVPIPASDVDSNNPVTTTSQ